MGAVDELNHSKPFVPVLERSSQLIDESFTESDGRPVIDATPLPVRKKTKRGIFKGKNVEEVAKQENTESVSVGNGMEHKSFMQEVL